VIQDSINFEIRKGYGVYCHFQQYFSYIVVVSFIGGGNRRKPPTCRKSLTNWPWAIFELTTLVVIGTDCIGSYKSNYHTITITTPSSCWMLLFHFHDLLHKCDTMLYVMYKILLTFSWFTTQVWYNVVRYVQDSINIFMIYYTSVIQWCTLCTRFY
jgi:hypothetical protein